MAETEGYRVPDVCRLVGISYRQLDYWARTGLVNPSIREAGGSGTQRLYSFRDLVLLRTIKQLLDTGLSLQQIRKAVEFLRDRLGTEPTAVTLMSDGSHVYAAESPDEVVDLIRRGQGVFAIAIDRVWNDLSTSVAERPPRRAAGARAGGA